MDWACTLHILLWSFIALICVLGHNITLHVMPPGCGVLQPVLPHVARSC